MKIKHLMMAVASLGMVAAPAMAAPVANPASSLSLTNARVATTTGHKQKLAGTGAIIGLIAAAAVGVGIYFAVRSTSN